jgi:hypothetical protein
MPAATYGMIGHVKATSHTIPADNKARPIETLETMTGSLLSH